MTRINRVLEHMAKLQVDSVIIKDVTTIRYLTGFTGDSSLLYLDRQQGRTASGLPPLIWQRMPKRR